MKEVRPVDYLATERTFLAYVRTSLSVMAFGFIIARFHLFLRLLPNHNTFSVSRIPGQGSEVLGLLFVIFGCMLAALGTWQYWSTLKAIRENAYRPNAALPIMIGVLTLILGLAVMSVLLRVN